MDIIQPYGADVGGGGRQVRPHHREHRRHQPTPPADDDAGRRPVGRLTGAGLAIAAAGLAALLAGRLHVLLHLFQLEHYEAAF